MSESLPPEFRGSRLRRFIRKSIEGVQVESERMRVIEPEKIHFSDVVGVFIRAWPYIRPMIAHVWAFIGIAIFAALWAIFWAALNLGLIYNSVIINDPVSPIAAWLLLLDFNVWVNVEELTRDQRYQLIPMVVMMAVVSGALGSVIDNANNYYRVWIMQNINQNLRLHLMGQLNHLSMKFHAESKTGDAIYRLFQDSAMVTQIIQALAIDPILTICRFLIGLGVVFAFSPILSIAILITWVPMLILANIMSPKLRLGFQEARMRNAKLTSTIQESIDGIRTIKVNGLESERQAMFEDDSVNAFVSAHDARVRLLFFSFFTFLSVALPLVVVELSAAILAYEAAPTFLQALLGIFAFQVWNLASQDQFRQRAREAVTSIESLLVLWGRSQDMAMGLNRVYQILDLRPEVVNLPDAEELQSVDTNISFDRIQFGYPDREVFTNVTFEAERGQITAVMGPTGCGKSTLMLLLLRMFEYQGGQISVNGKDFRDFTFESVRDNITLATQENILFSMSVRDNISYARPDATLEEVEDAARIAGAHEFIQTLPQGYETFLGERAAKLSTGQRQRLVIARAILKDTPVLILDEPTASLDADTELRIMSNIREWAQNRTVFLVTHRLSTIRQAQKIVFLKDGIVADVGSHDELMENPQGAYREFVEAELRNREQMVGTG